MLCRVSVFSLSHILVLALILAVGSTFALPVGLVAQDSSTEEKADQEDEDQDSDEDGTDDLDKAMDLSISARSTRDLDKIVSLCESAIEKGLVGEDNQQAEALMSSTLFKHAEQLSDRIFSPTGRDTRWRVYRREALMRLKQLEEVDPKNGSAHLLSAKLNGLPGGDREAALESIDKAVKLADGDEAAESEALFLRATLAEDPKKRLKDLTAAIEADPENLDAVRLRGGLYLQMEKTDKAIEDFRLWVEKDPENADAYSVLVQTLMSLKKNEEAIEVLDKAIEAKPDFLANYTTRAQLNLILEKSDKALEDVGRALKIDPNSTDALMMRASILFEEEKYDEALEDVNTVLDNEPGLIRGIWMRSIILSSQDKLDEAIEDVRTLSRADPSNNDFKYRLAMLYNANDEPEKSLRLYDRLIRGDKENAGYLRGRGDANLSLSKHKEAIADYEAALELDSEDDGVLNNLAWVLATAGDEKNRDGARAIELATKAAEITEFKEAHILSTLASGYAEAGDFDNAKKYAKQAIEVSDDDEQKESIGKELAQYEKEEPWREDQLKELEEKRNKAKEDKAKEEGKNKDDEEDGDDKDDKEDDKDKDDDKEEGDGN